MKRFYFPLLLLAAAAVAACQNKAAVEEPTSEQGSYVFTIKATSSDIETKTDYDTDGKFSWSSGDQISVLFHNGDENKFFTLTTKGSGASADFSGTIDEGYEIGGTDGNKWALYPAGSHSVRFAESDGVKYPLSFNIPAVTDYSASSFSANIPMYALGDGSDLFSFQYLCSAYKFTFSDIASSISKVKFVVENQTTYRLSGDVKLRNEGGTYLDQAWADGVDKTLTYISNVSEGDAVFYVPVRYYAACFQPVISLYNAENDDLIYTKTASTAKAISSKGHIQPINISVSGAVVVPWNYESAFGIDWTDSNVVSGSGQPGFNSISAIADGSYIYILAEIQKDALEFNPANYRENSVNIYVNGTSAAYGFLAKQGQPNSNDNPAYVVGNHIDEHKGVMYYEWKIDRTKAALADTGSVELRFCVFPKISVTQSWDVIGDWDVYMYAPASGAMTVSLP